MVPPTCQFVHGQDTTGRDFSVCNLTRRGIKQRGCAFPGLEQTNISKQDLTAAAVVFVLSQMMFCNLFITMVLNNSCVKCFICLLQQMYFGGNENTIQVPLHQTSEELKSCLVQNQLVVIAALLNIRINLYVKWTHKT